MCHNTDFVLVFSKAKNPKFRYYAQYIHYNDKIKNDYSFV